MTLFHGLELTPEQITIYNTCHKKAVKYFESIGLLPLDRKPYEYSLHHIDESLRHNDIDRYIQWLPEDLKVIKSGEHTSKHMIGNTNASGKRSEEFSKNLSERNLGNKYASGERSPESKANMSKAQKARFENGGIAWNKGKKLSPYSDEYKANMSERMKLWWAERKALERI